MTTAEKIAVMQACEEGKQIQICNWGEWQNVDGEPSWNWAKNEYRIKPEAKVRPYTFDELVEAIKVHGVMVKTDSELFTITYAREGVIELAGNLGETYENFLKCYVWLDGSPCGVVEE